MKKRSVLLVALMFYVCFVPVTSLALSWNNWTKYIQMPSMSSLSRIVDSETAKKLSLFALLASLAVYYYWMNKKDSASEDGDFAEGNTGVRKPLQGVSDSVDKTVVVAIPDSEKTVELQQYAVARQSSENGGPASCGYQTLLRSMQLVVSKNRGEGEAELKKTLLDTDAIQIYFSKEFGKEGEWRKKIIERRKLEEFKKLLHSKLVLSMKFSVDKDDKVFEKKRETGTRRWVDKEVTDERVEEIRKIVGSYKSILGLFENIIVGKAEDPLKDLKLYEFTDDAIYEYLQNATEKFNKEKNPVIDQLADKSFIDKYFDLEEMRQNALAHHKIFEIDRLLKEAVNSSERKSDFDGEWLNEGELEFLWKYEKDDMPSPIVSRGVVCDFRAIPDISLVGMIDEVKDPTTGEIVRIPLDLNIPEIKENIQEKSGKGKTFFNIIGMGTMSHTKASEKHWYALVRQQEADGNRKYYVMDSMTKPRTSDPNVLKIIKLIEQ